MRHHQTACPTASLPALPACVLQRQAKIEAALWFTTVPCARFLPFPAAPAGAQLVRINLSEQTDMMDLLGADLPVAGGAPGEFAW